MPVQESLKMVELEPLLERWPQNHCYTDGARITYSDGCTITVIKMVEESCILMVQESLL